MAQVQKKPQEDSELILRAKILARMKFRACVKRVMENLYWLQENDEVYSGDNVKKRVKQAMRAKSKKTNKLFTLSDKALLNKPIEERTEAEKKYIYRKIGGLKCFKRYPDHVKRKLAAATYFKYYGPNRVIVRQNQEAHAMYFVVTGEVVVSVLIYDEVLKKHISINVFVMHPGDMFGEVSLLHNIKRTATCTTSGHCEFLALMAEDFKDVLQNSLQKQWDDVTLAMNGFSYFDGLDEVARREGCIVAKMKSFGPDETILGDGAGVPNHVYFVLSGCCQMIESLEISCKEIRGKKFYTLHEPCQPENREEMEMHKKYFGERKVIIKSKNDTKTDSETAQPPDDRNRQESVSMTLIPENASSQQSTGDEDDRTKPTTSSKKADKYSTSSSIEPVELSKVLWQARNERGTSRKADRHDTHADTTDKSKRKYFMQVCIFAPGSTFGFGENMLDRRIVAMERVDCMMLPLVWLLQKNTANIWSRIKYYLEKKIPTKRQLFDEFVLNRRWQAWQNSLVEEIVSRTKTVNHTTIHDVPYSIRLRERLDI